MRFDARSSMSRVLATSLGLQGQPEMRSEQAAEHSKFSNWLFPKYTSTISSPRLVLLVRCIDAIGKIDVPYNSFLASVHQWTKGPSYRLTAAVSAGQISVLQRQYNFSQILFSVLPTQFQSLQALGSVLDFTNFLSSFHNLSVILFRLKFTLLVSKTKFTKSDFNDL